ncbi:MAG: type I glyceraldehyde-3-phosphate dehydrogenase [Bacteroidales bacterium]|nr:type I glyceraldehyde-3-phosphate dehydrogenase [Bacteroidales bacterium]
MSLRVGINGYGRIGKTVHRMLVGVDGISVSHINEKMDIALMAQLLKYDSNFGKFDADIKFDENHLIVNGEKILVTNFINPIEIPWDKSNVEIVMDSSGKFKTKKDLEAHLKPGVSKIILSSPPDDSSIDRVVVQGVNQETINFDDKIISNASCTTNCVAVIIKVLDEAFGLKRAFINTVHPSTNNQNIQDGYHSDYRRSRSVLNNIVPTSTSAIKSIKLIFPEIADCFDGFATRVPVAYCSFVEFTAQINKKVTVDELNAVFEKYSKNELKNYLEYCEDPIVSSDVKANTHSAIFDALSTKVIGGDFIQILAWYDNESGYSARIIDLIKYISK